MKENKSIRKYINLHESTEIYVKVHKSIWKYINLHESTYSCVIYFLLVYQYNCS